MSEEAAYQIDGINRAKAILKPQNSQLAPPENKDAGINKVSSSKFSFKPISAAEESEKKLQEEMMADKDERRSHVSGTCQRVNEFKADDISDGSSSSSHLSAKKEQEEILNTIAEDVLSQISEDSRGRDEDSMSLNSAEGQ